MNNLILTSLMAHQDYALSNIQSKEGQKAYLQTASVINGLIQTNKDYLTCLVVLEKTLGSLKGSPFSMNYEIKYSQLAIKHASEVVIAILKRFKQ